MNLEQRLQERPRRTLFGIGLSAIVIVAGLSVAGWAVSFVLNPIHQAGRIVEKTIDADNVIANYEWFKRQYHDVLAIDQKLIAAESGRAGFEKSAGDRASWRFEDRQEWNRLNAIAIGLRSQRASMVAEYNARTQMANRDLFRTSDLPPSIH
ncbi:hypothetical protein [Ochrobactrum soli]|uniref:hypothetical protein n=1 Tax=Ochrobactrum soli TaxID=2448455 RepID=UPI0011B20398|nr:hypothetical protein [[Ochrobactrum] soli]